MKYFTTSGPCEADRNYMMDVSEKVDAIAAAVEQEKYFTIARSEKAGKTTLLKAAQKALANRYRVIFLDMRAFAREQAPEDAEDPAEANETAVFCRQMAEALQAQADAEEESLFMPEEIREALHQICSREPRYVFLLELFVIFEQWISMSEKPFVLMLDNADSMMSRQVFWDFMNMLRTGYVQKQKGAPGFTSVIFTAPVDVRYAEILIGDDVSKLKIIPWNIGSDLEADLDFGEAEIAAMLREYCQDHDGGTEEDISEAARSIFKATGGQPCLVSGICLLAEKTAAGEKAGAEGRTLISKEVIDHAVSRVLAQDNASIIDSWMRYRVANTD